MTHYFQLYLEDGLFHDKSVMGKMLVPMDKIDWLKKCSATDSSKFTAIRYNNKHYYIDYSKGVNNYLAGSIEFTTIKKNPDYKLKIHIDDHLNIIIPEIKTIIISNYTPFPIYALYSIYDEYLNMANECIFNKFNIEDNEDFSSISNIINNFNNYLTSKDQLDKFNDGVHFNNILDFIYYDDMMNQIQEYLNFMSSLQSLQIDNKEPSVTEIEVYKKDMNMDELIQRNLSLEKLVQTLEIDNKKYRSDIIEYKTLNDKYNGEIYKLNSSIIQYTEDIQKSKLENLQQSRQLIELDIIKQNMIDMKKQIETLNETILQYQTKEQKITLEKQTIISKLSLQFEEIEKLKKELIESRKLEKQSNDNIAIIKKENLIISSQLEEKDNIIKGLKDKITEFIKPKEEINTIASYDSVLFEQIKELQLEIEKYKKQIESNKKENEIITKKYNDMQTKMKSLLGI
jgi:hypothetical protein